VPPGAGALDYAAPLPNLRSANFRVRRSADCGGAPVGSFGNMSTQRQFFAAGNDLLPVFETVEEKHGLSYTLCGLFPSREFTHLSAGREIPSLRSLAPQPSAIACPQYLVTPAGAPVAIREVPQKAGGVLYGIDQLVNPESIVVQPGGLYPPDVLLHGRIGTVSSARFAAQLQKAFAYAIAKFFERVRAFYVGPEARQLWRRGYRLTPSAQLPREYDLAV
jgi:hypothetical protein